MRLHYIGCKNYKLINNIYTHCRKHMLEILAGIVEMNDNVILLIQGNNTHIGRLLVQAISKLRLAKYNEGIRYKSDKYCYLNSNKSDRYYFKNSGGTWNYFQ